VHDWQRCVPAAAAPLLVVSRAVANNEMSSAFTAVAPSADRLDRRLRRNAHGVDRVVTRPSARIAEMTGIPHMPQNGRSSTSARHVVQ